MSEDTRKMLDEIAAIPAEYKKMADAAKAEAAEIRIDAAIDNADRLLKRGNYLYLRS